MPDVVFWVLVLGLVAQLPWVLLFGLGDGPLRGAANGLLALALGLALTTGAVSYVLVGATAAFVPMGSLAACIAGATLAILSARRAWIAGPREPGPPIRLVVRSNAVLASSLAALAVLVRGHRLLLVRIGCLGGAFAAVASTLHRYQPDAPREELTRALLVLALPASIAAAWLRIPLGQAIGSIAPTLAAMGASSRALYAGSALVIVLALFLFGAATGARIPEPRTAVLVLGGWSAALGAIVFDRARDEEPANVLVKATLVGAAGIALVLGVGSGAVLVALGVAAAVTVRALR